MYFCSPSPLLVSVFKSTLHSQQLFNFYTQLNHPFIQLPLPSISYITHQSLLTNHDSQNHSNSQSIKYTIQYNHQTNNKIFLKVIQSNSIVWKILKDNQIHQIKKGNIIKLGLVSLKVKHLQLQNSHQRKQSQTTIHLSQQLNQISKKQLQKTCKICLDNTQQHKDPLISLCKCRGSVQYTHFLCFRQWMKKFYKKSSKGQTTFYQFKGATCQICKHQISEQFYLNDDCFQLIQFQKPQCPYIILQTQIFDGETEILQKGKEFQLIKLNNKKISIGNLDNADLPIFDESVNRRHAEFFIENNKLFIKDLNSQFGTKIKFEKTPQKFNVFDGINLQFESLVLNIRKQKPFFNIFDQREEYQIIGIDNTTESQIKFNHIM